MKTVLTKFLAIGSVALLMLASCKKEGTLAVSNGGKPGTLTANVTTLALDKTKVTDTTKVIMFNFSKTSYGFNAAATNTLQIDVPSDNWAHPTTFTLGTGVLTQGFSTPDFNNLILKLNIPGGTTAPVNVRIANSLSANVAPVYSNTLALTVTPFNLTSWIYVPGDYQGWNINNPDSLISATGNGIYTGIINFVAGGTLQFKITPAKVWTNSYGSTDNATLVYNGGNNIQAPAAGQTLVTVNINTNTISFAAADYYSIIGSSTPGANWSTDLFLKFVNDGNNTWVGNFTLLAGQFKFRQDAAWSNSWGDIAVPDGKDATDSSGGNINATAGTHTVTFTMAPSVFGTSPPVTTTYSLQ